VISCKISFEFVISKTIYIIKSKISQEIKNSFDEFYAKESYEIPKINVIDLSRELLISKETTRRKIISLIKKKHLKKGDTKIIALIEEVMNFKIHEKIKINFNNNKFYAFDLNGNLVSSPYGAING